MEIPEEAMGFTSYHKEFREIRVAPTMLSHAGNYRVKVERRIGIKRKQNQFNIRVIGNHIEGKETRKANVTKRIPKFKIKSISRFGVFNLVFKDLKIIKNGPFMHNGVRFILDCDSIYSEITYSKA